MQLKEGWMQMETELKEVAEVGETTTCMCELVSRGDTVVWRAGRATLQPLQAHVNTCNRNLTSRSFKSALPTATQAASLL